MGFVLQKTPTFRWPVEIQTQSDGGAYRTERFTAVFNRLDATEHDALAADYGRLVAATMAPGINEAQQLLSSFRSIQAEDATALSASHRTMRQLADQLLAGWDDVFEADNTTPIPYSPEVREQLLNTAGVCQALVSTYLSSAARAKAGN